jgi:hypothetical protein
MKIVSVKLSTIAIATIAFIVLGAFSFMQFYIDVINTPSGYAPASCDRAEELETNVAQDDWQYGVSYDVQNTLTYWSWIENPEDNQELIEVEMDYPPLLIYVYDEHQHYLKNVRYKRALLKMESEEFIGEVYPKDFSYTDRVDDYHSPFFVDNEGWLVQCGYYK